MQVKKALVPKKNMGTTTMVGFVTSKNDNINIDTNDMTIVNLTSNNITVDILNATNANINQLNATNANIDKITTSELDGDIVTTGNITNLSSSTGAFDKTIDMEQVNVKLGTHNTFDSLQGSINSELFASNITTDNLTVLRSAHFFELVIDKVKASGGSALFTAADGFTVEKIDSTSLNDYHIIYWRACSEVAEGEIGDLLSDTGQVLTEKVSTNMWKQWDQALCQTFNLSNGAGTYQDISNTYWWRVVYDTSNEPEIQEIDGVKYYCHWIEVYKTGQYVAQNSDIPQVGDEVAQLGYRYNEISNPTQDDINRASAIMISAYTTPDTGVKPPSYVQYQDITDFNLSTHRKSYFDADGAHIIGEFTVAVNNTEIPLDEYIQDQTNNSPAEIVIKTNNANVNFCVLQVDSNDEIHDLNNFPQTIDLKVENYSSAQSISVQAASVNLFGRTINLLNFTGDSGNGIYIQSVTTPGVDYLHITFGWRGTSQTITNGSYITFVGQVTVDGVTYTPSKALSIATVTSIQGTDAELWQLDKKLEYAQVEADATYNARLRYRIKHTVGTTGSYIIPTDQKLKISKYDQTNTVIGTPTILQAASYDTINDYWQYTDTLQNWYTTQNKPIYLLVELLDVNDNILDSSLVNITAQAAALFSVEAGLTQSIQSNTTAINNETTARSLQYSAISQTVDNISSTVASQTTTINQVSAQVSSIQQNVNGINLSVNQINTDLDTLETGIQTTGIDITNGHITLNSDNTVITGDLSLRGDFVSDDTTHMNRITIDSVNGGLIMEGPTTVDDYDHSLPGQDATYAPTIKLGWEVDPDSLSRCGAIYVYDANHPVNHSTINEQCVSVQDTYSQINIYDNGIYGGTRNNTSQSYGDDYSYGITWLNLCDRRLRVAHPNSNWYDAQMNIDMITTDYNGEITINLPDPYTSDGKFYFIKHKRNATTYLRCTAAENRGASVIMNDNGVDTDWRRNVQDNSTWIICDGEHWILMELDY